jgi:DnaJ-class molecular chaperone
MEYTVLGLSPGASTVEVKAAYRREALKWHPDRHISGGEQQTQLASERFRQVSEAYEAIQSGSVR